MRVGGKKKQAESSSTRTGNEDGLWREEWAAPRRMVPSWCRGCGRSVSGVVMLSDLNLLEFLPAKSRSRLFLFTKDTCHLPSCNRHGDKE